MLKREYRISFYDRASRVERAEKIVLTGEIDNLQLSFLSKLKCLGYLDVVINRTNLLSAILI